MSSISPTSLSSTTPELPPRGPQRLSIAPTLATTVGLGALGVGLAATIGRSRSWASVLAGARTGAITGAVVGVGLLAVDHLTGGQVQKQLSLIALDRRAQIGFVLRHPFQPWLGPLGMEVAGDAHQMQRQVYGSFDPNDGAPDAFRHAYASALFTQRMMQRHGLDGDHAARLAIEGGEAHERDGQDNNDTYAREMDRANNAVGAELVGSGRNDRGSWLTEADLRDRVLDAMTKGKLTVVNRTGAISRARATTANDLPPQAMAGEPGTDRPRGG